MDGLLDATLPFAQQQLEKHGSFVPYGAVVKLDGKIELLAAYEAPPTTSRQLLETLLEGAKTNAASIRAFALVADSLVGGAQDAIRVDIEHRDGHAIAVVLPYRKRRFGRGYDFGELIAAEGVRRIWS